MAHYNFNNNISKKCTSLELSSTFRHCFIQIVHKVIIYSSSDALVGNIACGLRSEMPFLRSHCGIKSVVHHALD